MPRPIASSLFLALAGLVAAPAPGTVLEAATPLAASQATGTAPVRVTPARPESGESLVSTDLVALDGAIEPGKPFALGVRFTIAPKWHVYWKNPGDSGGAPGILIEVPKGFSVGPVEYPRPVVLEKPEEVTIGYERQVIYRVMITPPATFDGLPPAIALVGKLDWMVCHERCLMGRREVKVEFPLNAPIPSELTAKPGEFPSAAKDLGIDATLEGETLIVRAASLPKGTVLRFLPDVTPGVSYGATVPAAVVATDEGATARIPLTIKPQNALGQPLRAAGLVTLSAADGTPKGSAEIFISLDSPKNPTSTGGAIR